MNRIRHTQILSGQIVSVHQPKTSGVFLLFCLLIIIAPCSAMGLIDLKHGDAMPRILLKDKHGQIFDTDRFRGETVVVLFGESDHIKTRQACEAISNALNHPDMLGHPLQWLLVLSKSSRLDDPQLSLNKYRLPPHVLHDINRKTFGDYRVVALPSLVVIDPEGKVVHAMSGMLPRFEDVAYDAMLVSVGHLTYEEFAVALDAIAEPPPSPEELRAQRLIHLAEQLTVRKMNVMAIAKFREALELTPDSFMARIGLGEVLLSEGKYELAKAEFTRANTIRPASIDASLGRALALARGDTDDYNSSLEIVQDVLKRHPDSARAHYVFGMLEEQRGEITKAAIQYRTAYEILFHQMRSNAPGIAHQSQ